MSLYVAETWGIRSAEKNEYSSDKVFRKFVCSVTNSLFVVSRIVRNEEVRRRAGIEGS